MFTTPENTKDFLYRIRDKKKGDFERPKPPKPPKYTAITIKRPGRIIKDNIKSVLSKKYGELDIRDIFDDIKDEDVGSNISTAEAAIKTNIDKGFLSKDVYSKLPNL